MTNVRGVDAHSWRAALPFHGTLRDQRPLTSGNSRSMWAATMTDASGANRGVVVRVDEGGGPLSGTPLDLDREAAAYRALAGRGLHMPPLVGAAPGCLVIGLVPGDATWTSGSVGPLLAELDRLHRVPVADLDLPGWHRTAVEEVRLWASIADGLPADPFLATAAQVLVETFPGEPETAVLCHGDVGPGNVLFAPDGTLTGLVDWEFAHVGDPMDDLAWIAVRARLFGAPLDDLAAAVATHYARPVDPARFRYWRAVVVWRNLICCAAAIARASEGVDRAVHIGLVPALRALLVAELAGLVGVRPRTDPRRPPSPLPAPPAHDPGALAAREVARRLRALETGFDRSDPRRRQTALVRVLAEQLSRTWDGVAPSAGPADGRWTLDELAAEAARGLGRFPRAAEMAAEPLAGLEAEERTR